MIGDEPPNLRQVLLSIWVKNTFGSNNRRNQHKAVSEQALLSKLQGQKQNTNITWFQVSSIIFLLKK